MVKSTSSFDMKRCSTSLRHARTAGLDAELQDAATGARQRFGDARVELLDVAVDDERHLDAGALVGVADRDGVLDVLREQVVVEDERADVAVAREHPADLLDQLLGRPEAEEADLRGRAAELVAVAVDDLVVEAVRAAVRDTRATRAARTSRASGR
jgi:hypothetical protein